MIIITLAVNLSHECKEISVSEILDDRVSLKFLILSLQPQHYQEDAVT